MLAANCRANQTAYGNAWADAAEKSVGSRILFSSMLVPLIPSAMCHSALHDGFDLLPQELFAGGLQPMNQDLSDTLHQFVTKIAVTLSGDHEMGAVQDGWVPKRAPGSARRMAGTTMTSPIRRRR